MKRLSMLSTVVASVVFIGCGGVNINLSDYQNKVVQPEIVPDVCKSEYDSLKSIPKIAVLKFTNNSSFSKASVNNKSSNSAGGAVIAANENAVGVATASSSNSQSVKRVVDPKLDKAIASALEGSLVNMGGAEIYSRTDLDKIIKEQKLQQSGLFDDKTLVKVGKLAGIKYIVTGSIDSVTQEYKDYEGAAKTATDVTNSVNGQKQESMGTMAFKAVLNLGASALSGMKITTRATIKIIDVTTGKIVFSKQIEETKNIGKIPHPSYSQVIGGIKDDLMEGIKKSKPELSKFFAPSGYILQVRSDKDHKNFIAQINLGSADKIKPNQTFKVYKFDEVTDPVNHKTTCSKYTLNVKLTVSKNQIQPTTSWTKADGDDAPKLRPGQIVKRDALENSLLSF
jgi:hypothetical protein